MNVGFWGTVVIAAGRVDGDVNRAVERAVAEHGGHKSLYSDAFYDRDTFDAVYGGDVLRAVKATYDPDGRCDFVNRTWQDYTGITLQEARGGGRRPDFHPDDIVIINDAYIGGTHNNDIRLVMPVYVEDRIVALQDGSG